MTEKPCKKCIQIIQYNWGEYGLCLWVTSAPQVGMEDDATACPVSMVMQEYSLLGLKRHLCYLRPLVTFVGTLVAFRK